MGPRTTTSRLAHRGGVEPAAEADLEHRHVHAARARSGRARARCAASNTVASSRATSVPSASTPSTKSASAIGRPSTRMRSRKWREVRRGVEADAAARGLEHRGEHGRDRALAVGAADLGDGEGAARAARCASSSASMRSRPGRMPAMLPAAQREDAGHGLAHTSWGRRGGATAKKARMRRSVSRSSRRSTTRSSWPCSSRNSERWKPSGSGWRMVSAITRGPAKPMSARGSARMTSPSIAKLAVTPPVVGSVRSEM